MKLAPSSTLCGLRLLGSEPLCADELLAPAIGHAALARHRPLRSALLLARALPALQALQQDWVQARPAASLAHYRLYLQTLHGFQQDIALLYQRPALALLMPGLEVQQRLRALRSDLLDLALDLAPPPPQAMSAGLDLHASLGALTLSEALHAGLDGLQVQVQCLGLNAFQGARHLAGSSSARAQRWQAFCALLDRMHLQEDECQRLLQGLLAAVQWLRQALEDAQVSKVQTATRAKARATVLR